MDKKKILDKIDEICQSKEISISKLQRYFVIGFPRAARVMDSLCANKVVERIEYRYNILNVDALRDILIKNFIED